MRRSVDNAAVQELFPEPVAGWVRVAVDRPIDVAGLGFSYALPPELEDLAPGEAVTVPLGRGNTPTAGWIVRRDDRPGERTATIKHVTARRAAPPIPTDLIELGCWIARYYLAPLGPTLSSMVPGPVKRGVGSVQKRFLEPASPPDEVPRLGPAQKRVLQTIATLDPDELPIERTALRTRAGIGTNTPIDGLVRKGLLLEHRRTSIETAWTPRLLETGPPPVPTPDQAGIIEAVGGVLDGGFSVHLLRGVTGSGKTEVYLRLIERVLALGRSVLVLVPEIALTPQTAARLARRFPDEQVALIHSALPAAARNAHWHAIGSGAARIVLGARSGVFAPFPHRSLGLIVIDEEHDASYKQDASPRYHGRDVAIRRGQLAACPILLCSATPSLESWHNAAHRPEWSLHRLPERAPGLTVPATRVVNIARERRADEGRRGALGPTLRHALHRTLDEGHQVLLLLNRRGWATWIACSSPRCGWTLECLHCDATMVYHRTGNLPSSGFVRCHHCYREVRLPRTCPDCGARPARLGLGTQRIEEEVLKLRPELVAGDTLQRMDSDSMQRAEQYYAVLSALQDGRIRVLLGTQMIAKGLDVPGVHLVGVVDADTSIHLPDFRASERTCQLVSQVTGRCGRGHSPGLAIVQTMNPDAPSIAMAAAGQTEEFLAAELRHRREAGLPPATRMTRLLAQHAQLTTCEQIIDRATEALRALAPEGTCELLGPMPCPLARIRGRHRRESLLTAPTAALMQRWLHAAVHEHVLDDPALSVDVDPMSLL
jgi:primosomal protein N' (replication factor Y)